MIEFHFNKDEESPVLSLCLGRGQEEGNLYFAFDDFLRRD